jgi:hypothetical protein
VRGRRSPPRRAAALLVLLVAACAGGAASAPERPPAATPVAPVEVTALLDDVERRTFDFFWVSTNPANGLAPDRYPAPSFSSIAAIGFALTAYPVGVERGYVSRAQAAARVVTTLRFLRDAPQGVDAAGMAGYHGFFYHFLDLSTGRRYRSSELSTIDTALLMAGVLFAASYFDGASADEVAARGLADELYRRVDWTWAADGGGLVALGWTPEAGFHRLRWRGYNEAMILYVLGLGSPSSPLPDAAWHNWTAHYDAAWLTQYGQTFLSFPPLFGHQYSHVWIDFRGIQDAYMRGKGSDYFQNSRSASYAQQAYATANPLRWRDYGPRIFGLTACDGPGSLTASYAGERRVFRGYAARGIGGAATYDDGTIAPTGALGSIAFAPEIVLPALAEMRTRYGGNLYSTYGFLDAFNPSLSVAVPVRSGRIVPGAGWFDDGYLGIDQGPIIAMIENYRSELIWRVMRANPYVRRGLLRAGFTGGWLGTTP